MEFYTKRLHLRPWRLSDAESLYEYAKDPRVGPAAGWPVHTDVENSREIIKTVLSDEETYAVCLREDDRPIGSIGIMAGKKSNIGIAENEGELGFWIGVPFWGQGLIPEAVDELVKYCFDRRGMRRLWCGYFDGNTKSKRAQEKCGFLYHHTMCNVFWPATNEMKTEHITVLKRPEQVKAWM